MPTSEPFGTALLLATAGALMTASVLFSRASQRIGVPIALLFLLIGMLAGSEGLVGIAFDDYRFAFRLGSLALALILFDGGLNTPISALRRTWAPASVLATLVGDLRGGGTVLLHDSDRVSSPDCWRVTLEVLPLLAAHCRERGWRLGPLAEHGVRGAPQRRV